MYWSLNVVSKTCVSFHQHLYSVCDKIFFMPSNKENRLNITIKEEYSQDMQRIKEDCKKKGLSFSDEICRLVIKYHSANIESKQDEKNSVFPRLDKYLEQKINGKDATTELIRLVKHRIITPEQAAIAYLSAKSFVIQVENTEELKAALMIVDGQYTIYSKRESISSIVISKVTGNLVNLFQKALDDYESEECRKEFLEKQKKEREKWDKAHPDIPYNLRDMSEESRETIKLIGEGKMKLIDYDDDDLVNESIEPC